MFFHCSVCPLWGKSFSPVTRKKKISTQRAQRTQRKTEMERAMAGIRSGWITKHQWRAVFTVLNYLAALCVFLPLSAQQQGPMNAPAGMAAPPSEPKPAAAAPTQDAASKHAPAVASKEPPTLPPDTTLRRPPLRAARLSA